MHRFFSNPQMGLFYPEFSFFLRFDPLDQVVVQEHHCLRVEGMSGRRKYAFGIIVIFTAGISGLFNIFG